MSISHDHPRFCDPEFHPFPYDYVAEPADEPEPTIYCCVCGDEPVPHTGRACDGCMDSDDDEMRAMAVQANRLHMAACHECSAEEAREQARAQMRTMTALRIERNAILATLKGVGGERLVARG